MNGMHLQAAAGRRRPVSYQRQGRQPPVDRSNGRACLSHVVPSQDLDAGSHQTTATRLLRQESPLSCPSNASTRLKLDLKVHASRGGSLVVSAESGSYVKSQIS